MSPREHLAELFHGSAVPAQLRNNAGAVLFRASDDMRSPPAVWQRLLKRTLDLGVAVPLLVLLALPMALIALLIRLDSQGAAVFRQRRLGLGGRPFDILKFRTMRVLENGDEIVQARPDDKRFTRVGRWLRKRSLDELPQLINVVRGEMSLVGPRPHAVAHDRRFAALIEGYELRQRAKPGITGWAQIHGLRGPTPTIDAMRARVAFDIWYAQHASLRLDLRILLRTPIEILRQRNAF
ncbi:MAG: sugar transferase [Rhizomicrobium sp.]